jgi:ppGpp synthetase/RelA/SpoT-type nucleotidyltranferase
MMKIMKSISDLYEEQHPLFIQLQKRVDEVFLANKHKAWHYFSRVKEQESFALKLETGRVPDASALEDFFACTLVVENSSKFAEARALIGKYFDVDYQRPKSADFTHKAPDAFPFDDIRMYVRFKQVAYTPDTPVNTALFEVQVKTFLQHAWSIATHDLIYKSDAISWARERVAFQVKAMLEQAEIVIGSAEHLATIPEMDKTNGYFNDLRKVLSFITSSFVKDDLPRNTLLLAKNTNELLKSLNLKVGDLKQAIKAENASGNGVYTRNLSPYAIIVQSLINQGSANLQEYLTGSGAERFKVFIPLEVNLKGWTPNAKDRAVVFELAKPKAADDTPQPAQVA